MESESPIRYIVGSKEKYIETLQKRKAIIDNLCMSLCEFLSMDIDAQLENMDKVQEAPEYPTGYCGYTVENLVNAQKDVGVLEKQLEDIENANIPKEMKTYMNVGLVPQIKQQLEKSREYLKMVQDSLEKSSKQENGVS
jgi:hypothetical protein